VKPCSEDLTCWICYICIFLPENITIFFKMLILGFILKVLHSESVQWSLLGQSSTSTWSCWWRSTGAHVALGTDTAFEVHGSSSTLVWLLITSLSTVIFVGSDDVASHMLPRRSVACLTFWHWWWRRYCALLHANKGYSMWTEWLEGGDEYRKAWQVRKHKSSAEMSRWTSFSLLLFCGLSKATIFT
jgi:hypothetical protein